MGLSFINLFVENGYPESIGFLNHCCDFLKSGIYYFVLTSIYHSAYFFCYPLKGDDTIRKKQKFESSAVRLKYIFKYKGNQI